MYVRKLFFHNNKKLFNCQSLQSKHLSHDIRVRFAPSPTGMLHLGGLRTAFYNHLFAKKNGGSFILRIEDTDTNRLMPGSAEKIENVLTSFGLKPDESPRQGGQFGPYRQSDRIEIYQKLCKILLENGSAYKCFCSPERIKDLRKSNVFYDNCCRNLSLNESETLEKKGVPFCIRIKVEKDEVFKFEDLIYGEKQYKMTFNGDPVIFKSNMIPTYHYANVIDDHLMNISHVFRGMEWISFTTLHLKIYSHFNWIPPKFGHLPTLVKVDRSKLSKREVDLSIESLKEEGYSSTTILNFATSTGGGFMSRDFNQLYPQEELLQMFDPSFILRNPATLNIKQLNVYSQLDYNRRLSSHDQLFLLINELRSLILANLSKRCDVKLTDEYLFEVLHWAKNRIHVLKDFLTQYSFLWLNLEEVPVEVITSLNVPSVDILENTITIIEELTEEEFKNTKFLEENVSILKEKFKCSTKDLMSLYRLVLTGRKSGPGVTEIMALMGKERTLKCLSFSITELSNAQ